MEYALTSVRFDTDVAPEDISDDLRDFLTTYSASQRADGEPVELSEDEVCEYLDRIADPDTDSYVVRTDDGELAGVALVDIDPKAQPPRMWIEGIATRPECRGGGVGECIIRQLAAIALEAGCDRLSCLAQPNPRTLQFYTRLGFYEDPDMPGDYGELVPMTVSLPIEE